MKIRKGFVSNSSSSSFIVVWDKKPTSVKEIQQILFNGSDTHEHWDDSFNTKELSQIILNDTVGVTRTEIEDKQNELYQYDIWGHKNTWYSKGYKPDETLIKLYEIEANKASKDEKFYEQLLETYTDAEKKSFSRKNKLERIIGEKSISIREKEYHEIVSKLQECKNILWRKNDTMEKLIQDSTDKFMNDYKDKFIALYHYSDNEGNIQSCLEHSGVFDNLPHWIISHH